MLKRARTFFSIEFPTTFGSILIRINSGLKSKRSQQWVRLIAITGSSQAAIQAISFLSGILIIRFLPTEEYALYTLGTAIFSNMVILADSGIKASVMAQGGKVWKDRQKLGEVLATGFQLRKAFGVVSYLLSAPIMFFLLHRHGANWIAAIVIIIAILPAFYATLSGTLLEIVPKLHQEITKLQKIQLLASFIRLLFIGVILYFFPYTVLALLAFGIAQIWANKRLWKLAEGLIESGKEVNKKVRREIIKMVKRLMPDSIYLCISGQITIWLISLFGTTAAVAQIGALGRLAMILSFVGVMFGSLVSPRFSRLPIDKRNIARKFFQIQIGLLVLGIAIVGATWALSSQMLWILGSEYGNLNSEIVLLIIGNYIGLIAMSTFYLCTSRGWVINPLISIPLSLIAITGGAVLFDVSTLEGILWFNIFINIVMLVMHFGYGVLCIQKIEMNAP